MIILKFYSKLTHHSNYDEYFRLVSLMEQFFVTSHLAITDFVIMPLPSAIKTMVTPRTIDLTCTFEYLEAVSSMNPRIVEFLCPWLI